MFDIPGAIAAVTNLIGKFIPDPEQRAKAEAEIRASLQAWDAGQTQVNAAEAAHRTLFVAGWRPWIGWVCGAALAYQFVVTPLLMWGSAIAGLSPAGASQAGRHALGTFIWDARHGRAPDVRENAGGGEMTAALFLVLGAAWRLWDGRNHDGRWSRHAGVRNAVGVAIALAAVAHLSVTATAHGIPLLDPFVLGSVLWLAAVASLSIIAGRTRWEDAGYMALRYGVPALVAVVPAAYLGAVDVVSAGLYIAACTLAGMSYAAFKAIDKRLPRRKALGIDGWTAYGAMVSGAVIIGGLALL